MKRMLIATTSAAVLAFAPAFAQQVTAPPADAPTATVDAETQGSLKIEGVEPSKVLGAIDTSKLVDEQPAPQAEAQAEATVDADIDVATSTETEDSDVQVAAAGDIEVAGELPMEVAAVVADGSYTTEDLVTAQLEAVQASPAAGETITTTVTTTPSEEQAPPAVDPAG